MAARSDLHHHPGLRLQGSRRLGGRGLRGERLTSYTFNDVVDDHTISATFAPNGVNDAPVAVDDPGYSCYEWGGLYATPGADILQNDSDVDGDVLTAVLVGPTSHGTLDLEP